jgi:hypothetical protein
MEERKEPVYMNVFSVALAEETAELTKALEGLTKEEAAGVGAVMGITIGLLIAGLILWYVFQAIADWKIFAKAGEPGWKSLIPIYNVFVEYEICWSGMMGLVYLVAIICANVLTSGTQPVQNWRVIVSGVLAIVALIVHIKQSLKLASSFGKGVGFGICLVLFGPIARLVLGFGSARYIGKE